MNDGNRNMNQDEANACAGRYNAAGCALSLSGRLEGFAEEVERLENVVKFKTEEVNVLEKVNHGLMTALGKSGEARAAAEKRFAELNEKIDREIDRRMAAQCRVFAEQLDPSKSAVDNVPSIAGEPCPCGFDACDFGDVPGPLPRPSVTSAKFEPDPGVSLRKMAEGLAADLRARGADVRLSYDADGVTLTGQGTIGDLDAALTAAGMR
jgi:hypothetical protein